MMYIVNMLCIMVSAGYLTVYPHDDQDDHDDAAVAADAACLCFIRYITTLMNPYGIGS